MADWNNPTTSSLYTDFPGQIKDRDVELARGLDPNTCSPYPTNLPTNALRWTGSGGNYKLQSYNGTVWGDAIGLAMNITGSAVTLTNTRTFAISGDGTATAQNFNGSANVTLSLTLNTVAVAKGGTGYSSYAIGDMLYASGTSALSKLGIGSNGQVMTSTGTAPQWTAASSLAVGSASTATTASNLAGGGAGQMPYQNSAGQTYMLAAGTAGYVLKSGGAVAPSWGALAVAEVSGAAPLASPTFSGTPSLPTGTTGVTQTVGNNSTKLATTEFVLANGTPLSDGTPLVNGTAAAGNGTAASRYNHVHPTDTSRAATGQTFYIGTTQVPINRASAALTLDGVNVSGSSGSCTGNAATATYATSAGSAGDAIGVGQTWQNLTGSRALGVTYTNSTGRPIVVTSCHDMTNVSSTVTLTIGGILVDKQVTSYAPSQMSVSGIVPNGTTYIISGTNAAITRWSELR